MLTFNLGRHHNTLYLHIIYINIFVSHFRKYIFFSNLPLKQMISASGVGIPQQPQLNWLIYETLVIVQQATHISKGHIGNEYVTSY